jgi:hypothetical protein
MMAGGPHDGSRDRMLAARPALWRHGLHDGGRGHWEEVAAPQLKNRLAEV